MAGFESISKKIMRPPSAQNWTRLNAFGDLHKTTSLIANFAVSIPSFNYQSAVKVCEQKVQMGLDLETAIKAVRRSGSPAGRDQNESLIRAFYQYDEERRYGQNGFFESFDDGAFRVSREVRVPTKPTFTVKQDGKLHPVLVCGWQDFPFDRMQTRLFMTVLEFGLFSFSDYRRSGAEVLMFPMSGSKADRSRVPMVINRGDYDLLSERQLREQSELYVAAQTAALPIARDAWQRREDARARTTPPSVDPSSFYGEPDLFTK